MLRPLLPALAASGLSAARLVFAAMFPVAEGAARVALVVVAGVSDALDGLVARRFGGVTWWGAILDAASDKLFTLVVLATLLMEGQLGWWAVMLLLARDLAVLLAGAVVGTRRGGEAARRVRASPLGKATTAGLFAFFVSVLAWPDAFFPTRVVFAVACTASLLAAADYLLQAPRLLRTSPRAS